MIATYRTPSSITRGREAGAAVGSGDVGDGEARGPHDETNSPATIRTLRDLEAIETFPRLPRPASLERMRAAGSADPLD
jgi:hypothetical protein